jgi:hypothetical protein
MSANNYTICPKCKASREKTLSEAYGKVTPQEYEDLLEASPECDDLREDWEVGIWKGKFIVDYRARCSACSFTFSYKYEVVV